MCIQWGSTNFESSRSGWITFPIAFSSTTRVVVCIDTNSADETVASYYPVFVEMTAKRTTTRSYISLSDSGTQAFRWIAIGY